MLHRGNRPVRFVVCTSQRMADHQSQRTQLWLAVPSHTAHTAQALIVQQLWRHQPYCMREGLRRDSRLYSYRLGDRVWLLLAWVPGGGVGTTATAEQWLLWLLPQATAVA
eukprot:COSAG06_NODE_49110_length_327_cov_1.355263_1_plen_109_part_11